MSSGRVVRNDVAVRFVVQPRWHGEARALLENRQELEKQFVGDE